MRLYNITSQVVNYNENKFTLKSFYMHIKLKNHINFVKFT